MAAPAPTGNYGVDVHIDTGVLGLSSGGLLSAVQDLFVTPLWLALVWATHALVVMLEWSFTIDLLPGSSVVGVGGALRAMEVNLTQPWMPLALAIAAALVVYQGLIRRRIADTIGETLLMLAMMVAGLWVIADPAGTVGSLGELASRAALGTFAVAARGTPERPAGSFAGAMDLVFSAAIEAPWCYLEFGDVGWCREPGRLDGRLRAAGLKIADAEHALASCSGSAAAAVLPCVTPSSAPAKALERSEQLLREARTNGAIFLALPPNGSSRNSLSESASLLRVLCQSASLDSCRGPTASAAEFRSSGATWSRVGGLLLIGAGLLGMLLLLGFLALRLLAAAILSLVYLLLAPAMVLAPAFGERGRGLFSSWASQLLAAVLAKLLFSFLLGVMLAVLAVIASLTAIGWWTQWLLMSALWWGAFLRRRQAIGLTGGALRGELPASRRSFAGRVRRALDPSRGAIRSVRRRQRSEERPPPAVTPSTASAAPADSAGARPGASRGAERAPQDRLGHRGRGTRWGPVEAAAEAAPLTELRAQRERIGEARRRADAAGDRRRAAELSHRGERVEAELSAAQDSYAAGASRRGRGGSSAPGPDTAASEGGRGQAEKPRARTPSGPGDTTRRTAGARHATLGSRSAPRSEPARGGERGGDRESRRGEPPSVARERLDRDLAAGRGYGESSVMWDIREVEAGRKRQLGRGGE